MCLAVLGQVIEIDVIRQALVDYQGIRLKIDLGLVEAAVGDTVLIHAGCAIAVLDPVELAEWQKMMAEITDSADFYPAGSQAGQPGQAT
jgi:hydrogenase expression/formation protein HypC